MKFVTGALVGVTGFVLGAVTMTACIMFALTDDDMREAIVKVSQGSQRKR